MDNAKLLVFDFDGTLIDNTSLGLQKFSLILECLNLPQISEDDLREHWGRPMTDLFKIIAEKVKASTDQLNELTELEKKYHIVGKFDININNTLQSLHDSGYLLAILTSRTSESLEKEAKEVKLNLEIFDYIQTNECSEYFKPDGRVFQPLRRWARKHDLTTDNIIYIGDTMTDLKAAQSSQPEIKFIGIVSGATKASEFFNHNVCDISDYQGLSFFLEKTFLLPIEAGKIAS